MTEALVGSALAESRVTVGPVRVTVRLKVSAAVLGLPAASAAAPAAMAALTAPSPAGTRSNVYPLADTVAKFSSVALVGVMSAAAKPLTGSLKVTVTGIREAPVGSDAVEVMVTEGALRSEVTTRSEAAALALPAPSVAAPAPTLTLTGPSAAGVTSKVYVAPVPRRPEAVPLVTVTSARANPVTGSLKAAVTGMVAALVGSPAVVDRARLGADASYVRVRLPDALLVLPAASAAASAATDTVTVPSAAGVTSKVYVVPVPRRADAVPLVTLTSARANPVTGSLKVAVTLNGAVTVSPAVELSTTEGFARSTVRRSWVAALLPLPRASWAAPAAMSAVTTPSAVTLRSNA